MGNFLRKLFKVSKAHPKKIQLESRVYLSPPRFLQETLWPLTSELLKYSLPLGMRAENNCFTPCRLDCLLGIVKK